MFSLVGLFCFINLYLLSSLQHASLWRIAFESLSLHVRLDKDMASHSSILSWRSPWVEEPGGLQSMGSQRVGHN